MRSQLLNAEAFLDGYQQVMRLGHPITPRGEACIELTDFMMIFRPHSPPFSSFSDRKFNLKYAKRELLWYLSGDRFDTSILAHATAWKKLQQSDFGFNSNYGQYIFANRGGQGSQFDYVVSELVRDPDSRRASMVLLPANLLYHTNTDVVCTYAINFRIRDDRLHMTVMMRSNDMVWGLSNDAFCFWGIYAFVRSMLLKHRYVDIGLYKHFTNSMHIYSRHYEMVNNIIEKGMDGYIEQDDPPVLDHKEATGILHSHGKMVVGPFSEWLYAD